MKTSAPTLLPLLRSRAQGDIIAWVILHPGEQFSLTQIADAVDVSVPTVMREIDRLEDAGLVSVSRSGNQRMVEAETTNKVYRPLADLLAVTFGPKPALAEALASVPGIERAFIHGSWAARYHESPGPVPGDIDVLVIGHPDRASLDDAIYDAEKRLRREVNVRRVSPEAWHGAAVDDPFVRTVLSRPIVNLIGGHDA